MENCSPNKTCWKFFKSEGQQHKEDERNKRESSSATEPLQVGFADGDEKEPVVYENVGESEDDSQFINASKIDNIFMVGHYAVHSNIKLGSGKFGNVYLGESIQFPGQKFAVKVVSTDADSLEPHILSLLTGKGAPNLLFSLSLEKYSYYVMDMCGESLDVVLKQRLTASRSQNRVFAFNASEVSALGLACLNALQRLHSFGFLHADIKPANIVFRESVGNPLLDLTHELSEIRLIDFGLSRTWYDHDATTHCEYAQDINRFSGTLRYASINTHSGKKISRRDDLESLGYMLLHMIRGFLPWQGLPGSGEAKADAILRFKGTISLEDLCTGAPAQFKFFLAHVRNLKYDETPDYEYLARCLNFNSEICHTVSEIPFETSSKLSGRKRIWSVSKTLEANPTSFLLMDNVSKLSKKRNLHPIKKEEKSYKWVSVSFKPTPSCHEKAGDFNIMSIHAHSVDELKLLLNHYVDTHLIVNISHSKNSWYALLKSSEFAKSQEVHYIIPKEKAFTEFCNEKRSQGKFVSVIGASLDGIFVILRKCAFSEQVVVQCSIFSKKWVSYFLELGFAITAIASNGANLYISVSKMDPQQPIDLGLPSPVSILSQKIELSFCYPSETVHYWWSKGYFVTNIVSFGDMSIYVFSSFGLEANFEQRILRSSDLSKALERDSANAAAGKTILCLQHTRIQ
jgi:serine/threonine protein kinase